MMTWAIIDTQPTVETVMAYASLEDAVKAADRIWDMMDKADKKHCESFAVGYVNLDENGDYMELEDGTIDGDIRRIAVDFKSGKWDVLGILAKYGMSKADLSRRFDIPYRTVQNWTAMDNNYRRCPEYVIDMMVTILENIPDD